ncbi:MAG TPA: hypothetical protein VFK33_07440 [Bacillales bacterium]|nr:hypothetical protein [Bacillales bacterium]
MEMKKKEKKQQTRRNNQRAEMSEEFWYGANDPESEGATGAVDEKSNPREKG